jgi:uncharacterized protein (DUF433 family)
MVESLIMQGDTTNGRIVIDSRIQHGKPVIRDTRVPVARVVGSLAAGMSFAEIEHAYGVTAEDIRSALAFACELVEQEEFHAVPQGAH